MLEEIKFSLWCDFVERDFLETGFKTLIADKTINGATSNPAIFQKSFCSSPAYKQDIQTHSDKDSKEVYEILAIEDIKRAANALRGLYDEGKDGFISIEVDPYLCDDAQGTYEEGKRLFSAIGCPNVMIKVPATEAGYKAVELLVSEGINVNCTLIFSPAQVESCLSAIRAGQAKTDKKPATVLSIFVSRFDRMCDEKLAGAGMEKGRLGIVNAQLGYHLVQESGLPGCRILFASTGVKGDEYKASYYVDELLFSNCVNTAPLGTIEAFVKDGDKSPKNPMPKEEVESWLAKADSVVSLGGVYAKLMEDGVSSFKDSFTVLLKSFKECIKG